MPHTIDKPAIGPGITRGNDGRPTPGQLEATAARAIQGTDRMDGTTLDITASTAEVTTSPTFAQVRARHEAARAAYDAVNDVSGAIVDELADATTALILTEAVTPDDVAYKIAYATRELTFDRKGGDVRLDRMSAVGVARDVDNADAIRLLASAWTDIRHPALAAHVTSHTVAHWEGSFDAALEAYQAQVDAFLAAGERAQPGVSGDHEAMAKYPGVREAMEAALRAPAVTVEERRRKRDFVERIDLDNLVDATDVAEALLGLADDQPFRVSSTDELIIELGRRYVATQDSEKGVADAVLRPLLTLPATTMAALRAKAQVAYDHAEKHLFETNRETARHLDLGEEAMWRIMDDLLATPEPVKPEDCPVLKLHNELLVMDYDSEAFTIREEQVARQATQVRPQSVTGAVFQLAMAFNELKTVLDVHDVPEGVQEKVDIALDAMTHAALFLVGETGGALIDRYFGFDHIRREEAIHNAYEADPRWLALREAWIPILGQETAIRLVEAGAASILDFEGFVQLLADAPTKVTGR